MFTADVVIKENLKDLKHLEKQTAVLSCKVKNPTKKPVKWFKDGVEIKHGDRYLIFVVCYFTGDFGEMKTAGIYSRKKCS